MDTPEELDELDEELLELLLDELELEELELEELELEELELDELELEELELEELALDELLDEPPPLGFSSVAPPQDANIRANKLTPTILFIILFPIS